MPSVPGGADWNVRRAPAVPRRPAANLSGLAGLDTGQEVVLVGGVTGGLLSLQVVALCHTDVLPPSLPSLHAIRCQLPVKHCFVNCRISIK